VDVFFRGIGAQDLLFNDYPLSGAEINSGIAGTVDPGLRRRPPFSKKKYS
jgi:hypothetical protein